MGEMNLEQIITQIKYIIVIKAVNTFQVMKDSSTL